ncbi:MAG: hypothetical protein WCF85_16710 [Rhodospirillaceae bacterium]
MTENDTIQKGLVLGRGISLNLNPDPPPNDVLGAPLIIQKLPSINLQVETFGDVIAGVFSHFGTGMRNEERRQLWKLRQTIALVMASVSKHAEVKLEARGWFRRRYGATQRVVKLVHPDQLRVAFDELMAAPEIIRRDRRALELLLGVALRKYMIELSASTGTKFSFEAEAREHCIKAYHDERLLDKVIDNYERIEALQNTYNKYFYVRNYYMYSLIAREKNSNDGKMFSMYCRSVFFMSRLEWDGSLAEHVNRRRLPLRDDVTFLIKRDRALQERYTREPDFAAQIKDVLSIFPKNT